MYLTDSLFRNNFVRSQDPNRSCTHICMIKNFWGLFLHFVTQNANIVTLETLKLTTEISTTEKYNLLRIEV